MEPDCPEEDVALMEAEDDEVLVVEDGGGPPAPGGRGGSVRVLPAEVTLSAVTEFLELGREVLTGRALRGLGGGGGILT